MKRTPLRRKGGSRFPKRRDAAYMQHLLGRLRCGVWCDGCRKKRAMHRAHLMAKGSGGYDRRNVVLLCEDCHARQEKRTEEYMRETGVDLYAAALRHDHHYEEFHAARVR